MWSFFNGLDGHHLWSMLNGPMGWIVMTLAAITATANAFYVVRLAHLFSDTRLRIEARHHTMEAIEQRYARGEIIGTDFERIRTSPDR